LKAWPAPDLYQPRTALLRPADAANTQNQDIKRAVPMCNMDLLFLHLNFDFLGAMPPAGCVQIFKLIMHQLRYGDRL
jgi:hypothetical protein